MKELNFATGLVTYSLNGKAEITLNPTDSAFVERLYNTFEELDRKQETYKAEVEKTAGKRESFDIARRRDGEMRGMIDDALGVPVCGALSDPELDGRDKAAVALEIFYPQLEEMPPEHYQAAAEACMRFISGGQEDAPRKAPRLVDWEQDFSYIVAPINRVTGQEIRAAEYLHWWTFLAAYGEIGDCTFAQIVRIRDRLARGKPLDKSDRAWYRQNRHLVDFKRKYTGADRELFKEWSGA